jgi:hypothetical protein
MTAPKGVGSDEFSYSYLDAAMFTLIRKLTEKSLLLLYFMLGGIFFNAMLSVEDCDNVGNVEYASCVITND